MASLTTTIAGRITLGVLSVHIVVLPVLYFGMVFLVKQSNEELFINNVRTHARFLADSLERIGGSATDEEITEILDTLVVSGSGVFSELVGASQTISSSLVSAQDRARYQEDFQFGEHGDSVYFISVPILHDDEHLNLRVGFDEVPILEQNALAYRNGLVIIAVYLTMLLILLPIIGRRVVRPVRALQQASRDIASGSLSEHLTVETDLVEFVDLSHDLELMKSRLIGINQQLQQEIRDREQAVVRWRSLEQQLRHSQRLETVGTLAGGIAHELNNILVPIILYSDTAIEDLPKDSPIRADLQRVMKAATRAKGIVSQVLMFGWKMARHEYASVDMAEMVRDSFDLLQASMPATATLRLDIERNCPTVLGDPSLMSQLIMNLGTNACQALENAQGEVSISLESIDASPEFSESNPAIGRGRLVRLSVTDSGEGMDKQTIERIFEPFFTTREVGEGSGLGLSVVHGIVADLNGTIEVESAIKSGSTFTVLLPVFRNPPFETSFDTDN